MSEIRPRSAADYGLSMTEGAAARIHHLAAAENRPLMLRVTVNGGGCSGFQYDFSVEDTCHEDDLTVERDGARIVVDETSLTLLQGSRVDWHEDLAGAAFVIENPNATASCGCGTSFSIG